MTLHGALHRFKIIQHALTRKFSRLPILYADASYFAAVQRGDSELVPLGNAAIFSLTLSKEADNADSARLKDLAELCRHRDNQDSSEWDVARFLYQSICLMKPRCVIEVGVFVGATSCHLALGLRQDSKPAELHLVDHSAAQLAAAQRNLAQFGLLEGISFHPGDSAQLASSGGLPKADLIFLDGDHSSAGVQRDLIAYWRLLEPGGWIVLHDSIMLNGVGLHARKLARRAPREVFTLATSGGSGLTIIRKEGQLVDVQDLAPLLRQAE